MRHNRYAALATLVLVVPPLGITAQARVEKNVVVGMYSGLALLMDVHRPTSSNGLGVIVIAGSGWQRPLAYDAPLLSEKNLVRRLEPLVAAGYTLFALNHRATPRFEFPAPLEDVQRAVRFIRYHSDTYGIDPDRLGAVGGSSGGQLAHLLGTLDGNGDRGDPDPVNRLSAAVQAVVAWYAPAHLESIETPNGIRALVQLLGTSLRGGPNSIETQLYRDASPVKFVSSDDAPTLLIHGDADDVVPYEQSEMMYSAFREAGVPTRLVRAPGGGHGGAIERGISGEELISESLEWLEQHLRRG